MKINDEGELGIGITFSAMSPERDVA